MPDILLELSVILKLTVLVAISLSHWKIRFESIGVELRVGNPKPCENNKFSYQFPMWHPVIDIRI